VSGLCGIISLDGRPVDRTALQAMLDAGAHRGPDGAGTWFGEGAALGHLALHSTPEDRRVRQPLEEDGIVVAADARIDNADELSRALAPDGAGESGAGAARLIHSAYRRWGAACPERLLGDFAFAVWDAAERRLLLARDAMSLRPLYYRLEAGRLLFASEVGQIIAAPGVPVELEELMVAAHLTAQPMPPHLTFYRGIAQLPPAHVLIVEGGRPRVLRYWDVDAGRRIRYRDSDEYADHFRDLVKEAVRCRLRGDRAVGLMLSGGVDSGSVAATAGWLLENEPERLGPLRTYSYSFDRLRQCDERHVSRLITDRYRLPATAIPADDAFPLAGYPKHGPTPDAPTIMIYQPLHDRVLARARADGVATMMSGYRGDLLLGVFHDAFAFLRAGLWRDLATEMRREARGWKRLPKAAAKRLLLPAMLSWGPDLVRAPIKRRYWARMVSRPSVPPYPDWLRPEFAERVGLAERAEPVEAPGAIRDASLRDRYETIFPDLHARSLLDFERNIARHGLAFSDPWSDRRLAEFVLAIPQGELHRPSDYKRLARNAMRGLMPEEARRQVSKVTLTALAHHALRGGAHATIVDLIDTSEVAARGYVDGTKLQAFYQAIRRGERSMTGIWEILCLEVWLRRYWR
jgi:asparagine synthase (glutamine-hydrolysing)